MFRSYGLTVEEFNSISQQINSEKYLKRMIALQTYFYRIAGDLNANLKSSPPILPTISLPASPMVAARKLVDPYDGDRAVQKFNHKINQWYSDTTPELTRFATALLNIEYDRVNIREKLKVRELLWSFGLF